MRRSPIKSMPRGGARYRVAGTDHHLSAEAALLLNDSQPYEMEFAKGAASESFCLFFDRALAKQAWASEFESEREPSEFPTLVFRPRSDLRESSRCCANRS